MLPQIQAFAPSAENPCRKSFSKPKTWTTSVLLCLLITIFISEMVRISAHLQTPPELAHYSVPISTVERPTALAAPPDNLHLEKYALLWSLALTVGILFIAFLSKYVNELKFEAKKEKVIQYTIPQSPHQLRKPLAQIFVHINAALEKLNNSDPNGTADNLVAIEGECIHILQFIEEQPNNESLNQPPMKASIPNFDLKDTSKPMSNVATNGSIKINGDGHLMQVTQYDDTLIQKVMEQIHLNKDNTDFNVELLCRKVGMSYSQLHRKVTLLSGKNPNQLIKEARLARAKELLLNQHINIADVAFMSGYNDPSYFSRIFTKETGMTPSEFREPNRCVRPRVLNLLASA